MSDIYNFTLSEVYSYKFVFIAVTFAKLLFPAEAKLAMDIADADSADNVSKVARKRGSSGYIKEVDLNENPAEEARRITQRLEVLRKTGMTYINSFSILVFYK